jgi:AcrR family transcriptional regulator
MAAQREHILNCACDLYLEDGLEGFSMRKLARAVGVTAPALYRHYESKERLLIDVVGEAYKRLAEYLYRGLQGRTPEERFRMAGEEYLTFALENPRMYEVLFTLPDLVRLPEPPEEVRDQACAIGQFWNDRVRECMDASILRAGDPDEVGQTLWAHAHGLISLYLRGNLPVDERGLRAMYRASTHRILIGLGTPRYGEHLQEERTGDLVRDGRHGHS